MLVKLSLLKDSSVVAHTAIVWLLVTRTGPSINAPVIKERSEHILQYFDGCMTQPEKEPCNRVGSCLQ